MLFTSLLHCARVAARGKRGSGQVARFLLRQESACHQLAEQIAQRTYRPGPGRAFWIRDPKLRCIFALPFPDRVVQHWLIEQTLPAIEARLSRLSPHCFACRIGKGTHRCLQRATELLRRHRGVLRIDIQKFFPSIDHQIARLQLRRLAAPQLHWLIDCFLDAPAVTERADYYFPGDTLFTPTERPHGLPIGSLTSQIWANLYLSPIDDLISSYLSLPMVRYCDDLLIFSDSAARLRDAQALLTERLLHLRLRPHPVKSRLHRATDPVAFLGFVLRQTAGGVSVHLRQENVRRLRARMARVSALYRCGAIALEDVRAHLMAWLAHAQHGDTLALVRRELARLSFRRA